LNFAGEVVAVQTGTITTGDGIVQAGQSLNFATPCEAIAAMQPGKAKGLEEGAREIPAGWVPPITREIDLLSLRPFTRDDFAATLPFFEESVIREPKEADAWFRLGLCRDRLGNLDGAMEAYAKAVELKGDFAVAQNNYGIGHLRRKDPAKAAEALRAAVRAKPSYVEAQSSLAGVLVDLREYKEAAEAAEAAVKLNPGYAEAHLHLGAALFYLGEIEKAAAEHEVLQRLDRNLAARLKLVLETVWS
jgi:tetratricopeptide (TPR) repeat protein